MTKIFDIICIGAALVDMVAQVERHPEEDDEVFVSNLTLLSGGAAANTAYACAKIGLKTAFIGKLGKGDVFGSTILSDFNAVNVITDLIKYSEEYGTGSAFVALNAKGDRRIYAHSGAANYLSGEDILENDLTSTKAIFLSSLQNLEPFVKAAKIGGSKNIPIILNPGMLIIEQGLINIRHLLKTTDILIMSKREFQLLLNCKIKSSALNLLKEKATTLLSLGIKILIITMGKEGALIISSEKVELAPPIKRSNVVDTTGAGDAFSAGFIYGFVQNLSYKFEDIKYNVRMGNLIAGKCIEKMGARNGIPLVTDLKID
ncbi:MAG: carbohydrate kinase family protein [Promethearchaeota archaeon]|jgi:ribokinase